MKSRTCSSGTSTRRPGTSSSRLLAPDVGEALIQLILGRSAYSTTEEREAETLASLILTSTKG
jgi:hypothetical protein